MYFLAYNGPFGKKAINHWLYPNKGDAMRAAAGRANISVEDADHEPGRGGLMSRQWFS